MTTSDPIADLLTRIRNGLRGQHRFIDVSWSRMKQALVEVLKNEGLIDNFLLKQEETKGTIRVFLKYSQGRKPVIQGLKRLSSPGRRIYITCDEIPHFFGGLGISILSTPKGVMAGEEARRQRVGGEILCQVW